MSSSPRPWNPAPSYPTQRAKFAPGYKIPLNYKGLDIKQASRLGITAVSFGAMAGLFALFFFSDLPRVRKDIMQKVPFIGDHFVKDVPPSDNPF